MADLLRMSRWDELPLDKVSDLVSRKDVNGHELGLTQLYMKKGTIVPRHVRAHEQILSILQGALRIRAGAEEITLREGDSAVLPAGVPRSVECLDDTFLLVVRRADA